jgi:hypothetical protein
MAELSQRGFEQYGEVETTYGHTVRVYESSAAKGPHVWVNTVLLPETAGRGRKPEETTAHLDLVQALRVRDMLSEFIDGVPERWTDGARLYREAREQVYGMPPDEPEKPVCSFCGHEEARHTTSLPEEGRRDYCTECAGEDEFHTLHGRPELPQERLVMQVRGILPPGAPEWWIRAVTHAVGTSWTSESEPPVEDVCGCGHVRSQHTKTTDMRGASCQMCGALGGNTIYDWRHEFDSVEKG